MPYKNGKPNKFCECGKQLSSLKSLRCKKCNAKINHFSYTEEEKQNALLKRRAYKKQYYQLRKETMQQKRIGVYNKEKAKEYYNRYRYGIEPEEITNLLLAQENKCKICYCALLGTTRKNKAVIDHDHTTQQIRGIICAVCNSGLGFFQDNIQNLESAILYLQRAKNENTSINPNNSFVASNP